MLKKHECRARRESVRPSLKGPYAKSRGGTGRAAFTIQFRIQSPQSAEPVCGKRGVQGERLGLNRKVIADFDQAAAASRPGRC